MKIGVVSDTHDRLEITQTAIRLLCGRGAELILHCGDINSVAAVRLFRGVPTRFVLGNWDSPKFLLNGAMREPGGLAPGAAQDRGAGGRGGAGVGGGGG